MYKTVLFNKYFVVAALFTTIVKINSIIFIDEKTKVIPKVWTDDCK